jgi:hypothetical protein
VLPAWDLYCGVIGIENFRDWLVAYREQGLVGLNQRQIRSRLLVFVGRALAVVRSVARQDDALQRDPVGSHV